MKNLFIGVLFSAALLIAQQSVAAEKYVDAKLARVESCTIGGGLVFLFLKEASGAVPSVSNGCANDALFPYIRLTSDGTLTEIHKSMISIALMAYATEKEVRIRYDDEINQIISIAFK